MGRRVALRSAAALLLAAVVAGCICGVEADRLSKFQRKSSDPFTAVPERPAIQGGETADQKAQAEPLLDDNDGKPLRPCPHGPPATSRVSFAPRQHCGGALL